MVHGWGNPWDGEEQLTQAGPGREMILEKIFSITFLAADTGRCEQAAFNGQGGGGHVFQTFFYWKTCCWLQYRSWWNLFIINSTLKTICLVIFIVSYSLLTFLFSFYFFKHVQHNCSFVSVPISEVFVGQDSAVPGSCSRSWWSVSLNALRFGLWGPFWRWFPTITLCGLAETILQGDLWLFQASGHTIYHGLLEI